MTMTPSSPAAPAATPTPEIAGTLATVTAYTCEPVNHNPMHPCGQPRWGGNPHTWGAACPASWKNRWIRVQGYKWARCDDTPKDDYLGGLPHIDLRVPTVQQALEIGIQRKWVEYNLSEE